jgi:hypothetical protein
MITPDTGAETFDNDDGPGWRTLADLVVSGEPGGDSRAVEQIVAAARGLNWPMEDLARLSQASQKASGARRIGGPGPACWLCARWCARLRKRPPVILEPGTAGHGEPR